MAALLMSAAAAANASASEVTKVEVKASSPSAGAKDVVDEVSFKATTELNPLLSGYVRLTAPAGTVFASNATRFNNETYTFVDGTKSAVSASVEVKPEGAGENVVDVYVPFNIAAGDTVKLDAYAVSNPSTKVSGKYAVSTSSDVTPAEKPFEITAATSPTVESVIASSPSARAKDVVDEVSFKATTSVSAGTPCDGCTVGAGYVRLTAPAGTVFASNATRFNNETYTFVDGTKSAVSASVEVKPEGAGENVVDVYVPFNIAAGDTVKLDAYAVSNPSTKVSGKYSVATSSDVTPAEKPFEITAATSPTVESVIASSPSAGAKDVVDEVSFKATTSVSAGTPCDGCTVGAGYVRLTAPAGTVFASNATRFNNETYTFVDGTKSAVSASVEVKPEGAGENVVDVYVPFNIAAGDTVKLDAYAVSNPSTKVSGKYAVSTSSDVTPAEKPFEITAATSPTVESVIASSPSAGAKDVVDEVSFKATTSVSAGTPCDGCTVGAGYVRLTAPAGTVFASNATRFNNETYTFVDGTKSAVSASVEVKPEGAGENVVDVYVPFNIAAGDTVKLDAYAVSNPSTKVSGKYAVSTSSDVTPAEKPFEITAATSVSGVTSAVSSSEYVERFVATTSVSAGTPCYGCTVGAGYVQFSAPSGVTLPAARSDYQFLVGGSAHFEAASVTNVSNVAQAYVAANIAAGEHVQLTISGVTNASAGEAHLSTSSDTIEASVSASLVNSSPPAISGSTQVGQTLSCSTGSWTGNPPPSSFAYQWLRDGAAIAGATSSSYVVQAADQGHTLSCQVTASNSEGQLTVTSAGVAIPVPSAPSASTASSGVLPFKAAVLAAPVSGHTSNLTPVSGTAEIKLPGTSTFIALSSATTVPVGTIVNATHGRVTLCTAAKTAGTQQCAEFYGGEFQILQKPGSPNTQLILLGGNFKGCPGSRPGALATAASSKSKKKKPAANPTRSLWGDGHGNFTIDGRNSAATVRGTVWFVEDKCTETITKVKQGLVSVLDFRLHRSFLLHAGHTYIAKAR